MNRQNVEEKMSEIALHVAKILTAGEAEASHLKWPDARAAVAKRAGIAPGALESLERGRLKFTDRIGRKLDELFIEATQRKIAALEHELALARLRHAGADPLDVRGISVALETARRLLDEGRKHQ